MGKLPTRYHRPRFFVPGAQDGFVDSDGVKIHYVSLGRKEDPLVVLIHGFPDFWYSWRAEMPELAKHFHVVAIDQRGYNLSGQPEGVENYTAAKLVGDAVAVVKHFGAAKAVIVGHDWGGLVAWTFAMTHPEITDRLIVLNLPHPRGLLRELATTRTAEEQPVRPQLSKARRGQACLGRLPDRLGQGSRGPQGLSRRFQAIVNRRNAQLLQGKLSTPSR